jgi:hypothetical protein
MRPLCSNPPPPPHKHMSQQISSPFSQDSSAERGQAFRRAGPLRARSTSTTIDNRRPRVAQTLRRAVVALRMWWADGAGCMIVASLAAPSPPQRLAFGNAMESVVRPWTDSRIVWSRQACCVQELGPGAHPLRHTNAHRMPHVCPCSPCCISKKRYHSPPRRVAISIEQV